jgi:acetyl-CoA carboxylase biotin carboxyl carrier protein
VEEMMNLTQEEILLILKILKDSEFDELDLQVGSLTMKARRKGAAAPSCSGPARDEPPRPENPLLHARAESNRTEPIPPRASTHEEGLLSINAPILGTFYRRPSPKEPPFVEIGTFVNEDDTVCLIEVMKVFSTVKAGISGRIKKVCVEAGDLVEFGQILFLVEPGTDRDHGAS